MKARVCGVHGGRRAGHNGILPEVAVFPVPASKHWQVMGYSQVTAFQVVLWPAGLPEDQGLGQGLCRR